MFGQKQQAKEEAKRKCSRRCATSHCIRLVSPRDEKLPDASRFRRPAQRRFAAAMHMSIPCRLVRRECKFPRLERRSCKSFRDPRWLAQRVKEFCPFAVLAASKLIHLPHEAAGVFGRGQIGTGINDSNDKRVSKQRESRLCWKSPTRRL